ncbi:MAG TPA: histidine kinase [Holophagaceae bacterium]|nr:histidine kinase [Holophagaceae bacterium]
MTRSRLLPLSGLLLRLAGAWYLLQVLLALLVGGVSAGLLGGLLLFPYSALVVALVGTVRQAQGTGGAALGPVQRLSVQAPWDREAAAAELTALLQEDLGALEVIRQGGSLRAAFGPPAWAGRLRRWSQTDELTVELPDHPGDPLEVEVAPTSRLFTQVLWVDGGRNARRLARLKQALAGRLAATQAAAAAAQGADAQAARLAQAELRLLRAQVEPHHFFNTLAHLRELVRTGEADAAVAMVDALVAHAQATTEGLHRLTHPLAAEAATVEAYAQLLTLRFGTRLRFHLDLPPEVMALEVPVGTLLIPVENAVKHGLEPRPGGGSVTVRGTRNDTHLTLEVRDDGVGLPAEPPSGTGLANLRRRLQLTFGPDARLRIEDVDPHGVRVGLDLPLA